MQLKLHFLKILVLNEVYANHSMNQLQSIHKAQWSIFQKYQPKPTNINVTSQQQTTKLNNSSSHHNPTPQKVQHNYKFSTTVSITLIINLITPNLIYNSHLNLG